MKAQYEAHVAERQRLAEAALAATGFDALLLHSGTPFRYFADDMDAPFHSTPHFAHWVPLTGPHHLLLVRPGQRPRLVRLAPEDYWHEPAPLGDPFWADAFELVEVGSQAAAWSEVSLAGKLAFIGDDDALAHAQGIDQDGLEPAELVARLDWDRSFKTAYEVACTERAQELAALGHLAARTAFEGGASELEVHQAYVGAVGCTDAELPYESIVALNEKGATLHYTGKRKQRDGRVLLIDSGARHLGYCSDITRTWTRTDCDPLFRELVAGMDALQLALCDAVAPGLPYPELHRQAQVSIGELLHRVGVLKLGGEDALAQGLVDPFFPHGLGHFLGIQVHDVSGHQKEPSGGQLDPPAQSPFLRTTRTIEEHQIFTIEPGIYFIEMLLREHRSGPRADLLDWSLVERLSPCGGVRIEDNVLVTADGHRNLTRPHI